MLVGKIVVYDADGKLLQEWGKVGSADGEFNQPGGIAIGPDGLIYVVDQANHTRSFREWQDEMLEVSTRWLNTHFVGDLAVQPRAASVQVPAVSHS